MPPVTKRRRQIYILLPLLFLLLCIGGINLVNRPRSLSPGADITTVVITGTPLATQGTETRLPQTAVSATPDVTAVATIPPTLTPLPTPTLPATATITLLGPPNNAVFVTDATISFYWQWPLPLVEGQQVALYRLTETGETLLGSLLEPNVGKGYSLRIPVQLLAETAVSIRWYVRLETANQDILVSSDIRQINLVAP